MTDLLAQADAVSEIVLKENKDLEDSTQGVINVDDIVKDANEMLRMTERLCKNFEDVDAGSELIELVKPYMEAPQLLDSTLNKLMKMLTQACINAFGHEFPQLVYICIYTLSNIRGFRELLPLFPNQVELFETVTKAFCQEINSWEVKYVLCLWLAQLSLVPFDIATIGTTLADDLLTWSKKLLGHASRDSEASAFFLSRFLSRKDLRDKRNEFIKEALDHLNDDSERLVTDYLRTMFYLFNGADRDWVPSVGQQVVEAMEHLSEAKSVDIRRFHVKIIQQIGLAYLPPRVAAWRYQQSRSIKINENNEKVSEKAQNDDLYMNKDEFNVEPIVEQILGTLFNSLESHLVVVRWSSSKGIGRIVERLPFEDALQAVNYLFTLFDHTDNENLIHGACLTLAQFNLRGIVLPSDIPRVLKVVLDALVYDSASSSHTVAESVRDSGCFVCWALARTYDGGTLNDFCLQISQQLVNVFLFDRCVNVRRSASAAFQENVGRHGRFPNGLELIHIADFITVSSKVGCYSRIANFVAQFQAYGKSIVKYLVTDRLKHWDEEIRLLAASGLGIIAENHKHLLEQSVIDEICVSCCSIDSDVKHGALEALGCLLRVIEIPQDQLLEFFTLDNSFQIDNIKCSYIKFIASAKKRGYNVPHFEDLVYDWLQNSTTSVQKAIVESLMFINSGNDGRILSVDFYNKLFDSVGNSGVASSLCAFPKWYVSENISTIVEKISQIYTDKDSDIDAKTNLPKSFVLLSESMSDEQLSKLLLLGMNDRTITKKGDEGWHVRYSALQALEKLIGTRNIDKFIIADIIKLCLDRISTLREFSLHVLGLVVKKETDIPGLNLLKSIVNQQNCNVEHFNILVDVPEYTSIVVEGLILCSGAYAPDLSRRSKRSLLSFMRDKDYKSVIPTLVNLYRKQWGVVIFATSLFAFIPSFVGSIVKGEDLDSFANEFLDITSAKYIKKQTYQKLKKLAQVLASFSANCSGEVRKKSFEMMSHLFVSEFAVVRDKSAVELFSCLKIANSHEKIPFFEEVSDILTKTEWKLSITASAESVKRLCVLFDVPVLEVNVQEENLDKKEEYSYKQLASQMY